jgi:NTP pyrophosphatase (non-canonical NTP hydrolase)
MKKPITLRKLQKHIKKRDFKPKKKQQYFMKLIEEVGELSEMIKKDKRLDPENLKVKAIKGTMEEELADVLYYVIALANVYDIDLTEAFLRKQALKKKNERRNQAKKEGDTPE